MKKNSGDQTSEFNSPRMIANRLLFIVMAVAASAAFCLLAHGLLTQSPKALLPGIILLLLAIVLYHYLRRRGELAPILQSLDNFGQSMTSSDEFSRLVQDWEDLLRKRGTAGFDPWHLLNLRREIEHRVRDNPALAEYWRNHSGQS